MINASKYHPQIAEYLTPVEGSFLAQEDQIQCKYLPYLVGWASSSPGLIWRLASNSVCLMQESHFIQWYYHGLKPYIHYIPIRNDISDIYEKIIWAQQHDHECLQIAENARAFVRENLSSEHHLVYFFHVLKKYESLQKFDVIDLENETENNPDDWIRIY